MHTVLYFGSFNPVHDGHIRIAGYMLESGLCDRVRFVVSPRNPFKEEADLAGEQERLEMVRLAVSTAPERERMEVSDVEFILPRPSWTIDTLDRIREQEPRERFSLLMGEDNLAALHTWKEYGRILGQAEIYVYPRREGSVALFRNPHLTEEQQRRIHGLPDAPLLPFASTEIRNGIRCGAVFPDGVNEQVKNYIRERGLYGYRKKN